MTTETFDDHRAGVVNESNDFAVVLFVEFFGEQCRANKVAEEDGEIAPLPGIRKARRVVVRTQICPALPAISGAFRVGVSTGRARRHGADCTRARWAERRLQLPANARTDLPPDDVSVDVALDLLIEKIGSAEPHLPRGSPPSIAETGIEVHVALCEPPERLVEHVGPERFVGVVQIG
jgi:hypothetical protein